MGTRNLTCVVRGGDFKVAQYGQWDGYPSGNGVQVLEFLKVVNLEAFAAKVSACKWMSDDEVKEAYAPYSTNGMMSMAQSEAFKRSQFAHLSRDTGADILQAVLFSKGGLGLQDQREFGYDGLMCEWAYVVDLDGMFLEVYKGFQETPATAGRWVDGNDKAETTRSGTTYYPIQMVKRWSIYDLPSEPDFLEALEEKED